MPPVNTENITQIINIEEKTDKFVILLVLIIFLISFSSV
jgi:hypothetical protein